MKELKIKQRKKSKKKKLWAHTINNVSNSAESVDSTATNLGIREVLKIKTKKKKRMRKHVNMIIKTKI